MQDGKTMIQFTVMYIFHNRMFIQNELIHKWNSKVHIFVASAWAVVVHTHTVVNLSQTSILLRCP